MASLAEPASSEESSVDAPCPRRQMIITAANELLEEGGLEGLTIRAVLKRTGLARRAFYERFAGKDDLVLAVFEETMAEAGALFQGEAQALASPLDKLRHVVRGLVLGALTNQTGVRVRHASAIVREHMRLAESRPAELERGLRPLLQAIADPISEGIRAGQLRPCDPDLQARLIYNLLATTIHPELLKQLDERTLATVRGKRLADEIWEFCRRAIVA
jgi:AcrR family transcriptional regulator